MAMLQHPVDDALMDMDRAIRQALAIFMEDNHLSERERAVYDILNAAHRTFERDRSIDRAAEYYRRNPENPSGYGQRLLHDAGLTPIDLDAHRAPRTVIPFPGRRNDAG